jgi:type II secretion system (T2SS) protein E
MLAETLRARLRAFELTKFESEPCANPNCHQRTKVWHGYVGHGTQFHCGSEWCCSPECFEAAIRHAICKVIAEPRRNWARGHRVPLGLLLVAEGVIDHTSVRTALEAQRKHSHGRIGYWLRKLGFATEQEIAKAVAQQWSCAVYPLHASAGYIANAELIPIALLKSRRMLPVHFHRETKTLHVAFSDAVDYPALHAVEQMLDCRTIPCIARDSHFGSALAAIEALPQGDVVVEEAEEVHSMARIVRSHFVRSRARDLKIVRCGEYIWVRILGKKTMDLLFRNKWKAQEIALKGEKQPL